MIMNLDNIKKPLLLLYCLALSSCSLLDTHQIDDLAKQIKIYSDHEQVKDCRYVGEIVGSEGHWYSFFFLSNSLLTLSSIIDLKNQAYGIGANSVHIDNHMGFNTSVTFIGQAYDCQS